MQFLFADQFDIPFHSIFLQLLQSHPHGAYFMGDWIFLAGPISSLSKSGQAPAVLSRSGL